MASTIEKAKASDPKLLQQEIARLKHDMARQPAAVAARVVEKPVVDQAAIQKAVARAIANERKRLAPVLARLQRIATTLITLDLPGSVGALAHIVNEPLAAPASEPVPFNGDPLTKIVQKIPVQAAKRPDIAPVDGDFAITGARQNILNAIATLNELGVDQPSLVQVALFVGVSHTTGSYQQNVRNLADAGYLARGNGQVTLTAAGKTASQPDVDRDPIEFWKQKLPGAQSKLFALILDEHPISREALAAKAGVSHTTGSYQQNLRDMRTYGIVDIEAGLIDLSQLLSPHAYA